MSIAFWLILRWVVAGVVGALIVISAMTASVQWEISLLAGWDTGLLAWLILTGLLLRRASRMSVSAQTPAPRPVLLFTLVIATILSLLGLVGASVLVGRTSGASQRSKPCASPSLRRLLGSRGCLCIRNAASTIAGSLTRMPRLTV